MSANTHLRKCGWLWAAVLMMLPVATGDLRWRAAAWAQGAAGSQPAAGPSAWGPSKAGLQIGLSSEGAATVGAEFDFRVVLRNVGSSAVKLPTAGSVCGWFLVGQQDGRGERKFYTQRYYIAIGLDDWATQLEPNAEVRFKTLSVGDGTAYASVVSKELLTAYAAGKAGGDLPGSEGRLCDVIVPGQAVARFTLLLPQPDGTSVALASNGVEVRVNPRPLKSMTPEERKAYVDDLLKQFNKDEWAALKAHDSAVALGKDVVADLIEAVKDRKRPKYSRMWLATALADIRDEKAADALAGLLEDPVGEVRYVVGYHGPKQKSDRLDGAIIKKVEKGPRDTSMMAYSVLGYSVFRGTVPEALLKISLDSPEPKVRNALMGALRGQASDFNMSRLMGLLSDPDEKVRASAARMLQQFGRRNPAVMRALVAALDLPGETARKQITQVLVDMTRVGAVYDPAADEAARKKTLKDWKDWVAKAPKGG